MLMLTNGLPPAFSFSQSSLQDYVDCPRRFQLRYLQQLAWPAVETEPVLENERRQKEGQFFHRLVQQHRIGLPPDRLRRLASTPTLGRWWDNYIGSDFDLEGFTEHSELSLSAPLGPYRLLAKYDLIAVKPTEKVLVYDWKTYHLRPKDEWMAARLQTRVYRALLVEAGASLNGGSPILPEQIEMVYWYAEFPTEPARFPYSSAQHRRDWEYLTDLIGEIDRHSHFDLTTDEKKCAYCPYRSYCNRGIQAGSDADIDPETELADLEINFEQIQEIEF